MTGAVTGWLPAWWLFLFPQFCSFITADISQCWAVLLRSMKFLAVCSYTSQSVSVVGVRTPLHSLHCCPLLPVLSSVRCQPHTEQHQSVTATKTNTTRPLPGHHQLPAHPHLTESDKQDITGPELDQKVKWKHFVSLTCSSDGTGLEWRTGLEGKHGVWEHQTRCSLTTVRMSRGLVGLV